MTPRKKRGRPKQDPEARQQQILGEATKVFARCGYAGTDLQAVADALGIAKGTLYLYFGSKQELFLATVDHAIRCLSAHITESVAGAAGPTAKIRAMVGTFLEFAERDLPFARVIMAAGGQFREQAEQAHVAAASANIPEVVEILQEGIDQGVFRPCNPEETARVVISLMHGVMLTRVLAQASPMVGGSAESVTEFILEGLRNKENVQ